MTTVKVSVNGGRWTNSREIYAVHCTRNVGAAIDNARGVVQYALCRKKRKRKNQAGVLLGACLVARELRLAAVFIHLDKVQSTVESARQRGNVDVERKLTVDKIEHLVPVTYDAGKHVHTCTHVYTCTCTRIRVMLIALRRRFQKEEINKHDEHNALPQLFLKLRN
jgi:hypothetical protein